MDIYRKILKISLKELSADLGVAESFIVDLHDENNSWNFISKLAQLIEGVFTKILVQRLNEPEIYGVISNLPQSVRINLAHDLGILSKDQKFLFLTIAEIRNDYIHNISNVQVILGDYLVNLKQSRKSEIFKRFKVFIMDEKISTCDDFLSDCKNQIFAICALEIARIHGDIEGIKSKRKHMKFRADQAEKLLPKMSDDAMYLEDMIMIFDYVKNAKEALKKCGLLS